MSESIKKEKESIVDKEKKVAGWFQTRFVAGIFVFFPLAVTYFILNFAFNLIDGIFRPYFETLFNRTLPGLSFILIIILVLMLGILASNAFTRRKFSWIENILKKIPVIGATYSTSKEIAGAFRGGKGNDFGTVVAVQYPKDGVWTVGFLTKIVDFEDGLKHGIVYMPSTPVPNTGWMVILPIDQVRYLDISADKAFKFIIGGGIGSPGYIDWIGRESKDLD
tara:strand:+ start:451 stop:1116 length:666 start_codon:yes stop_codon:yes gene_type:complete